MNSADWLLDIAQIAMSLTGFSGLLIAFRFGDQRWKRIEVQSLRFLFQSSIGAFVLALIPLPLFVARFEEELIWTICFAALGAWILILSGAALIGRLRGLLNPELEVSYWALTLSGLVMGAMQMAAAIGLFGLQAPAVYMIGLYWLLAVAIIQLMTQVMRSLDSMDSD
ncbi:MAG TPA: hypothetical protein VHE36_03565 [Sphingomicrobium sp.]|nr:hypothetical protein [Sphingomicrobium sp.]